MNLTQRDHEILRTLVRVQFATTASLGRTFFPDLRAARRRLLTLRSVGGLIVPHAKGLPGKLAPHGGQYWRLTETGLQTFAERFPRERIPNNHISRTRNASLLFFEHRNAMTDLYLRLIACKDRDIGDLHARANNLDWRCEWEVVLDYQALEGVTYKAKTIVPDATLTSSDTRFFLEVDQSTESRSVCRRTLRNYSSALEQPSFAKLFPDRLPVVVLYVTKGHGRAEGLKEVVESAGRLPYRAVALPMQDAAVWLSESVAVPPGPLPGSVEVGRAVDYDEVVTALMDIYTTCREDLQKRAERGEQLNQEASVLKAYEVLNKIHKAA